MAIYTSSTTKCTVCKTVLTLKICRSAAGYYLGFECPNCGPHDRVSSYYETESRAQSLLDACMLDDEKDELHIGSYWEPSVY